MKDIQDTAETATSTYLLGTAPGTTVRVCQQQIAVYCVSCSRLSLSAPHCCCVSCPSHPGLFWQNELRRQKAVSRERTVSFAIARCPYCFEICLLSCLFYAAGRAAAAEASVAGANVTF